MRNTIHSCAIAVPIKEPLNHEKMYVITSKTHWRSTAHRYRLNAGSQALRDNGQYDEIVERHLEIFRDQLK